MRTLVTIDDRDIQALDELANAEKVSRAELIRQAVHALLAERAREVSADAFGLWGGGAKDGLSYQEELRSEW